LLPIIHNDGIRGCRKETRRLAAIMFTDMVGYTALGQKNENLSLALVQEQKRLIRPTLSNHNGREIKTIGDGFLVEFPSAVDAVRWAYDIQRVIREFNLSLASDKRIHLRIGIHLGEVEESQGDISGDAVNLASRIESLAEDGGVCLTQQVYDHVRNKTDLEMQSLGSKALKNVAEPVGVYKMVMPWGKEGHQASKETRADTKRLAVLPFLNMSPDPNDSYFADGITEEIITIASTISGLSVISRTSVMGYKGTTKKIGEIGRELDVGSILEGSFRKAGNRIRITTQLINVNNDSHVWAQSYDREMGDVFAVQSDIAKQVAEALKVKILPNEKERIEKYPTSSTEAYSLYLKGRYFWSERTDDGLRKSLEYFRRAVEIDPNFAHALSGMADTYSIMAFQNLIASEEAMSKAKALAERALSLDDGLAEAHTSLAYVYDETFDRKNAEAEYRKSLALNPSYATGHFWYSIMLTWLARHEEAISHAATALKLDPLSPAISISFGQALVYARRYGDAIKHLKEKLETDPSWMNLHFVIGIAYLYSGQYEEAEREARIAVSNGLQRPKTILGEALARMGRISEAQEILADMERRNAQFVLRAVILTDLGEKDKAIGYLEEAFKLKESGLSWISVIPAFDALKSDVRFISILQKINVPLQWGEEKR